MGGLVAGRKAFCVTANLLKSTVGFPSEGVPDSTA